MSLRLYNVHCDAVALHIDIGQCGNKCFYCYATCKNLKSTTSRQIINAINKEDAQSLTAFYVKNRYPVCISNHSDIFNCDQFDVTKETIKILRQAEFPFYWMTKGTKDKEKLDWFFSTADPGKDIIYMTITSLSGKKSKQIEPNVIIPTEKIVFLENLLKRGFTVEIGFNPVIDGYITEEQMIEFFDTYPQILGYHIHQIHFDHKRRYLKNEFKQFQISSDLIKEMKKRKIKGYSKNLALCGLTGLGQAERDFFKKSIFVSDDVEEICQKTFKEFSKDKPKKELLEYPHGFCGIEYFIEQKRELFEAFKDCVVTKAEIKAPYRSGSYFYAALPDKMTYLDYFRFLWDNPELLSPMNYSRTFHEFDEGMLYWIVNQPYFQKKGE